MAKMGMEYRAGCGMSEEEAQRIAVGAFTYIANDEAMLTRFISVTGVAPNDMRAAAMESGFLAGVLDFLMGHEPDAVAFANEFGIAPDDVGRARLTLTGNSDPNPWMSV